MEEIYLLAFYKALWKQYAKKRSCYPLTLSEALMYCIVLKHFAEILRPPYSLLPSALESFYKTVPFFYKVLWITSQNSMNVSTEHKKGNS